MNKEGRNFFIKAYERNLFGGNLSRSGPGSEGEHAKQKTQIVSDIIEGYGIKSILDIGCGDVFWMRDLFDKVTKYVGVDIVPQVIEDNKTKFPEQEFFCKDMTTEKDLAEFDNQYDLILALDVFHHLMHEEIESLVRFLCLKLTHTDSLFLVKSHPEGKDRSLWVEKDERANPVDIENYLKPYEFVSLFRTWPGINPIDQYNLYVL